MFTDKYLNLLRPEQANRADEVRSVLKDVAEWHWNNWETNHIVINPYENTVCEDIVKEEK